MVFSLVSLLVLLADQLSKAWIRANIHPGQSLTVIGFLRIIDIHNTGAIFGFFPHQSSILIVVTFISIPAIIIFAFIHPRYLSFLDSKLGKSALGLILGGDVGNMIDRLRFGYVTDFIDLRIWPTFNIADSAITIGVIMFAYCLLYLTQAGKH